MTTTNDGQYLDRIAVVSALRAAELNDGPIADRRKLHDQAVLLLTLHYVDILLSNKTDFSNLDMIPLVAYRIAAIIADGQRKGEPVYRKSEPGRVRK